MTNQLESAGHEPAISGPVPSRFLYWDRADTWPAFVAARIPSSVICEPLNATQRRGTHRGDPPTCLLLADDVAAPDVLYDCVRRFSDHSRTLILIVQRAADPALSAMLCEAGAHAVLCSIAELILWVPAVRKWLGDEERQVGSSHVGRIKLAV